MYVVKGPRWWPHKRATAGDKSFLEKICNCSLFDAYVARGPFGKNGVCPRTFMVTGFQSTVCPNQEVFQVLRYFIGCE